MRWEASNSTVAVLLGVASRICSQKHVAFLCSSHLAFSPNFISPVGAIISTANTAWKKSSFISSEILDFHMIDNLSIVVNAFSMHMLTSLSVVRYINWSTNFRGLPLKVEMATSDLKHMNSVLSHRG